MKYFIDTEFKEQPNTIDLISIGIVCEDGSELYAINKDVNLKSVWKDEWLKDNVLLQIYKDKIHGDMRNRFRFTYRTMKMIFRESGRTISEIRYDILGFMNYMMNQPIEFYGYYADYDWVVFCWIFGRMIDLPDGMPMYCRDLKQMMDDKGLDKEWKRKNCPNTEGEHNALVDAKWNLRLFNQMVLKKP